MNDNPVPKDQGEEFLRLLRQNEKRIYVYILTAVSNRAVAEDIMQETMVVMWRKFDEFEPGTKFSAWGTKIARFFVLDYYRKNQKAVVHFDTQALENIMNSSCNIGDIDSRSEALRTCVKKLPENLQQIIRLRYTKGLKIKEVALIVGKPIHGMYKRIAKIHFLLQECIEKTFVAWGVS